MVDDGSSVICVVTKGKVSAGDGVGDAASVALPMPIGLMGRFCPVQEAVSTILMKIRMR